MFLYAWQTYETVQLMALSVTIHAGYVKTRCSSTQSFPQFHAPLPWRHSEHDRVSQVSQLFSPPFIQGANQRKHQSSASLAFVRGIHRPAVNSPHKGPVTRRMFPFHVVIMNLTASRPGLCSSPTKFQPSATISYSLGHFVPSGNTVRRHYNAVDFLPNPHKKHPLARSLGWDMRCNLWFDTRIYILIQSTQCCMK